MKISVKWIFGGLSLVWHYNMWMWANHSLIVHFLEGPPNFFLQHQVFVLPWQEGVEMDHSCSWNQLGEGKSMEEIMCVIDDLYQDNSESKNQKFKSTKTGIDYNWIHRYLRIFDCVKKKKKFIPTNSKIIFLSC